MSFAIVLAISLAVFIYPETVSADQLEGRINVTEPSVGNEPPIASIGGPYSVMEGGKIELDGAESRDPDGEPVDYSWKITSNLSRKAILEDSQTSTPFLHAPLVDSDRKIIVSLTVKDEHEAVDREKTVVTIKNNPAPADFSLTDLSIDPENPKPGEIVTISTKVRNHGEQTDDYEIELLIENRRENTETVELDPNTAKIVQFTTSRENEKTYRVKVNDLTGSFTVEKPLIIHPLLITISLFLAVIILIILFWWFFKDRRDEKRKKR
ncbi:hypothetical protein AKJ39_02680 [candidate division MSBL1 archaeon SCGC-AAA259J03]|nr:hypothetical protein AKJ39_02680 [candidate division MSBL1 archaeon SCGC-AAA259J03]